MDGFLKKVCTGNGNEETHKYFLRFGKGKYEGRFIISMSSGSKVKIKASFELANDFVEFAKEIGADRFSGKVLSKQQVSGLDGRKKAGVFAYEVQNSNLSEFSNPYYCLTDCETPEIKLRIKKALPKPGKDAEKVDDGFCVMEIDQKHLQKARDTFFWDIPDGKKMEVSHTLEFNEIIFPEGEKNPVKIRENSLRKGKIIRKAVIDGKEFVKEYSVEA